jgi:hypothetical protein
MRNMSIIKNQKYNTRPGVTIYCDHCQSQQPMHVDYMRQDTDFPHQGIWGDICCATCALVLNSVHVPSEGNWHLTPSGD